MTDDLTDKRKMFCIEYLRDFNATQAAIRAGYSESSARQIASDLLSKHDIQDQIQSLSDELNKSSKNEITKIINELQLIAFGALVDVADWDIGGLSIKDSKTLGDKRNKDR
jgi:phage terminase small subunit